MTVSSIFVVTDYINFNLFKALHETKTKMTRDQALVLSYNLLCAVKFLHSANILHRDLKPANILTNEMLQVKICDFGLARGLEVEDCPSFRKRKLSPTCFTRFYRPPEVIVHNEVYGESADVWSLGCVLSEIF